MTTPLTGSSVMPHRTSPHTGRRRGFSLVELLVVIGILVGLLAIVVPVVVKARKAAARARQAADLQTIGTALDAYKADFGDYPRPFANGAGFATLGYALISPAPSTINLASPPAKLAFASGTHYQPGDVVVQSSQAYVAIADNPSGTAPTGTASDNLWAPCLYADFADGPGFRQRQQGQTYGPYLQADKFKLRGYAILDIWGNPILYFPARAGAININKPVPPGTLAPTYVWDSRDTNYNPLPKPLFDVADNLTMLGGQLSQPPSASPNVTARQNLQVFLGDTDKDGWIGSGESAVTTGPYILWSAGADAEGVPTVTYGYDANGKTDDVTNFDIDASHLKK